MTTACTVHEICGVMIRCNLESAKVLLGISITPLSILSAAAFACLHDS